MTLVPAPYRGRPLGELVADLARGDPAKIVARWQRDARPTPAPVRAAAVSALGEGHIVHRDIKPANIVLRQGDSSPVLIDFGLALDLTAASPEDRAQVGGTPLFMTPDAFTGAAPEPSWDAYALGLT